jgi:hypothetical protein
LDALIVRAEDRGVVRASGAYHRADERDVAVTTHETDDLPGESTPVDPDGAIFEAPALLRILWADPQHMPEHLAVWSLKHFASRAVSAVDNLRRDYPNELTDDLEQRAIERQTHVAIAEGAVVGGPFIVLIPIAFCAALLAQAQMSLELAALAGYAPDDEMRAADLLVIQGAYASPDQAGAALATVTRDQSSRVGRRLPRGSRISMIKRMAYLLGVLQSNAQKRSVARVAAQWTLLGLTFVVGLVLPLVWMPYMAFSIRRSALQMAERSRQYYAQRQSVDTGVAVRKSAAVHVAIAGGVVRMIVLIIVPIVVAVIALSTGADLGTGRLLTAGIVLIVVSAVVTLGWITFRWWRHRRWVRAHPVTESAPSGPDSAMMDRLGPASEQHL